MSLPERSTRKYHRAMFMAAAVWALDTPGHISIIRLGIWGKLAVFSMVTLGYIRGEATLLTLFGGVGELVFVGLFVRVLSDFSQVAEVAGFVEVK